MLRVRDSYTVTKPRGGRCPTCRCVGRHARPPSATTARLAHQSRRRDAACTGTRDACRHTARTDRLSWSFLRLDVRPRLARLSRFWSSWAGLSQRWIQPVPVGWPRRGRRSPPLAMNSSCGARGGLDKLTAGGFDPSRGATPRQASRLCSGLCGRGLQPREPNPNRACAATELTPPARSLTQRWNVPMSWPWARIWPWMALTRSVLRAVAGIVSLLSSAKTLKK